MGGFGLVSGYGDDKEGANMLNVIIWVESAVFKYEPRCVAKRTGGDFGYVAAHRGGTGIML